MILVDGRLYTLAHGILAASGQWRGKAATLALGGGGAVGGARSGGGDCVDHERAALNFILYTGVVLIRMVPYKNGRPSGAENLPGSPKNA